MKRLTIDGVDYRLPNALNAFQLEMYLHLIRWKWEHITREPGTHEGAAYDAILPEWIVDEWPVLYPDIKGAFRQHLETYPFRIHKFFNHMASSQAANAQSVPAHPAAPRRQMPSSASSSQTWPGLRLRTWITATASNSGTNLSVISATRPKYPERTPISPSRMRTIRGSCVSG